jgi:hypothetical protein
MSAPIITKVLRSMDRTLSEKRPDNLEIQILLFDIYFNCAYARMNYSNLNSQAGSHNTRRRGVRDDGRPA